MSSTMQAVKLGKLNPKLDYRTLQYDNYAAPGLSAPPKSETWAVRLGALGMMGNDRIGDCTCAAAGHMIEAWTANAGTEIVPTDADIIAAYSAITGYVPGDESTDQGAAELDVLNYWRKTGIGGHKISAFVQVRPMNHAHVKEACWLFGGLYIGMALPLTAQTQNIWHQPACGNRGQGEPGSWGGHAVPVVAYDAYGLTVVTWGALKRMTWGFWSSYCDEAYAVLSPDWFDAAGHAPSGFDFAALQTDLKGVTG